MKMIFLALSAVAAMAACSRKSNLDNNKKTPIPPVKKDDGAKAIPPESVKYAGAMVFELGSTLATWDTEHSKPKAQIFLCIDKSDVESTGEIAVDFKELGVAPFTSQRNGSDGVLRETYETATAAISYRVKGKIETLDKISYGTIDASIKTTNLDWQRTFAKEPGTTAVPPVRQELFEMTTTPGTLFATSTTYYQSEGKTYYVAKILYRTSSDFKGNVYPIADCEANKSGPVFIKKGDEIKKPVCLKLGGC